MAFAALHVSVLLSGASAALRRRAPAAAVEETEPVTRPELERRAA
jgi:hypothetical protein